MPRARPVRFVLSLVLALGVGACDTAPGVGDEVRPPDVTAFAFTPTEFTYDGDGTEAQIPLTITATVEGGAGGEVRYLVRPQFGQATVAEGVLTAGSGGQYSASPTLTLDRGATGLYQITVVGVGFDGQLGSRATGLFRFDAASLGPPVITAIEGPITFDPPGVLVLTAVVTDPDGLANVARVDGETPNGSPFQLFDDGVSSGDPVAGDGRYTASFDVPSATPGPQTFTFFATDRDGLVSAEVQFTVTIVAP